MTWNSDVLQDLLSELADAGVLGVEISKIPRMRRTRIRTDCMRRRGRGRGRRRWATVQIDIARISIFCFYLALPLSSISSLQPPNTALVERKSLQSLSQLTRCIPPPDLFKTATATETATAGFFNLHPNDISRNYLYIHLILTPIQCM